MPSPRGGHFLFTVSKLPDFLAISTFITKPKYRIRVKYK